LFCQLPTASRQLSFCQLPTFKVKAEVKVEAEAEGKTRLKSL